MRKKTLSLAVALAAGAVVMAPSAAIAGDLNYTLYGNVHVSLDFGDDDDATLNSNTSAVGLKGGKKLGDSSNQVIFKIEWQVDPTERNDTKALVDRDQWVGFKGDFGKIIAGTASSNYKQKGGKVDSLYRTRLEGRGFLNLQSRLHNGASEQRGRLTNMIQYTTPKFGNMSIVANATFSGDSGDESYGIGARYKTKNTLMFADFFSAGDIGGRREDAFKVGGSHKMGSLKIGAQYEDASDTYGYDYFFVNAAYKLSKVNTLKFTVGEADGAGGILDNFSYAIAFDHKLGKKTNMYVGYGKKDVDGGTDDDDFTLGVRYKF